MLDNPTRTRAATGAVHSWAVLAVCSLSLFVVGLDATIVTVALPAIADGVHVGTQGLEWIVDAYTLALASFPSPPARSPTASAGAAFSGSDWSFSVLPRRRARARRRSRC
jgi:hypothetical protein